MNPQRKSDWSDLYGEVWRTGGTKTQTGDQLDDFLEVRAAKVETGGGPDSTTISLSCLKGDFDDVFKAFVDLLQNPEFRADKLDIAQKQGDDAISRRNDRGRRNCRSRIRQAGLRRRQSLCPRAGICHHRRHHAPGFDRLAQNYVHPNNIILGISGDFDSAAMEAKLRAAFDSWPKGPASAEKSRFNTNPPSPATI